MALQLNKVFIAGNLTRAPEVRFFENGKAVAKFGLACNRTFRGADGEKKEETCFVDIQAWGRTAELVGQYLDKGRACMVEGRLTYESWEDKEGNRRNRLSVTADNVQFLSSPQDGQSGGGSAAPAAPSAPPAPDFGDEAPPF